MTSLCLIEYYDHLYLFVDYNGVSSSRCMFGVHVSDPGISRCRECGAEYNCLNRRYIFSFRTLTDGRDKNVLAAVIKIELKDYDSCYEGEILALMRSSKHIEQAYIDVLEYLSKRAFI